MKRYKVLVIASYPAPYRVGVFKELSHYFNLETYFDTCANENRSSEWFCKSGDFSFSILDNDEARQRFKQALKNINKFDFVLAYDPVRKPAIKAIFKCRFHNVPYYVNNDGAIINKNFLKDSLKKFLYRGAKACFSSGHSATEYFKYYGIPEERIPVHNFSSLTKEDILLKPVSEEEKSNLRRQLNIEDKKTVITVGQFIHRKGFDVLLRAWKQADDKAQLLIIGGGDEQISYEKFVKENGLQNVRIIGFMQKEDLFRYYCASDIFVLPTREDVWGLVVNEAMAVGLPVITTDNCNAGLELIENGINGYIVPVENDNELAEKILYLLSDSSLCKSMSINNLEKIENFTIEKIAQSHIEVINKTM